MRRKPKARRVLHRVDEIHEIVHVVYASIMHVIEQMNADPMVAAALGMLGLSGQKDCGRIVSSFVRC